MPNVNECCNELWKVCLSQNIIASWNSVSQAVDIVTIMDLLQKFYVNERSLDRVEIWTSYQPEHIANVSVICYNERRATFKQVEDMAKEMHRGNLNISSGQQVSDISDIFNPNQSQDKDFPSTTPNIILIEGVPGIGKTILSREIAFQWACKGLLSNTMLLFLVHLRDLQISQITSLQQLVCYATKLPLNNKMVKAAVDYMENKSGENCTMVFDGYDEISEMVRKDSLVAKIIRRDILQLCRLVITSRPSASTDLHRIIDRRVEVLGFTKDDRNEYIRKNLQENEAEMFQQYLQNNPFISGLCYIPLNMTILLNLFKELASPDNPALPKTQTDINNQFIYKTISHFISQKKKKTVTIKSPDDLQMPYKQYFTALCKLAFDLLGKEMVAFSDADVQKYTSKISITNWSTFSLGLLREANYYSIEENKSKISYSYLHLSMQECLAAHYIAKKAENIFFKKYFWDPRYLNVGVMYIGLTKGKSTAFKNFISGHSGTFGRQFGADKVTVNDKVKKLHFFHCLLEVENNELSEQLQVDEILHDNIIDLSDHILQHKDIHTLGFFLSRSTIKYWKKLDLSNSYINDEGLEDFSKFCDSKVTNVSIDTIDLSHNNLSSSVDAIINLIRCFKVKNTIIADSIAESQTFKVALLSIVTKVKKVSISSTGEGSRFLMNYELNDMDQNFLGKLEYKRQLYAWNTNALLSIPTLIKYCSIISIYEENVADEKIANIASELKMISEETGNKIMYSLQSANEIIAYGVEFYQISQSLMSNSFLMHNTNCKIVDLRQCRLEDKHLIELNQILCTNHIECLETLIFSFCSLTASSFPMVLEIFKCCVVKRLIISDNLICNKALCSLIFSEVTVESKILNCKLSIPLTVSINGTKCIFFTNINFSDAIIGDYDFVNSQLYFSNIGLNKGNFQSFLMLCRNNKLQVNLFELNIADDIINGVLTKLEPFKDNTYVLASSTRLIAFNAKHRQIMEAVASSSKITILKLINCEISLSELDPLDKLLSKSSHNWDLIDLSGCNIKDEGCLSLYERLTDTKNQIHIGVLNLSSNCLESDSVICTLKMFENCVIKTLIFSWNDIPAHKFSEALKGHLLAKKQFLNFKYEIPLQVYESDPPYELCSVYAFQTSDIVFSSKPYKDNTLYNLYHVQCAHKYFFNHIFKILLTSDQIKVHVLAEGVMNEKVCSMFTKLAKLKYDKCGKLPKVDFSSIHITDQSCKLICDALLSDKSSVKLIEELDFSSHHFSLACAPMIIELFQYCVIKHLVLPSREVLDKISETILKDCHAGKTIVNFTEKIPLTVNIETEFEEEGGDGITYSIVANTYLQDYKITVELFNHYEDVVINQITTSHTFILLDCLIKNKLDIILSILYTKASYIKICIFELKLTNDVLDATVDHLRMLKKEIYRDRLRYVLASDSKIVAYNAKRFQILQALQIKPRIYDLEITHCFMSKDNLRLIALTLIGKFNLLKNIKVIACKIKDGDFFSFCDILSNYPKTSSIILKTMDFSHNLLTPSSIGTILKLLQCSVIEKLILSNNSINDTTLTDAVYQLARYKWSEICNVSSGIPLVIINMPSSQHCKLSTNRMRCATIFHMNCEIHKSLLLEYCSQAKKIYFLKSVVANGDLRMNLSILYHCLSSAIKIVVYEIDLNDDVVQEAAICLRKEGYTHINFILASRTKLLASSSSYHQIAPLLENNLLINNLQLKKFAMPFPYDCRFTRTIRNTNRTWELVDLSGCNIRDNGCLRLQECFVASSCTITHLNLMYNNLSSASAAAVANMILKCNIKMVNISSNTLQHNQVIDALSCLKQNSATALSVELISGDSAAIIVSNTDPKLLPYHLWSSNCKIQLCVMHHLQVDYIDCILSSILQALQIKPRIYDLEITHCFMSKDNLRLIALTLIGKFNLLKNIKVIACKIKDGDFFSFCDILSNYPKTSSIILKTMDFSHNLLTPSSIGTILKLLQCSVIEKLILSNNSINDTTLTDAVYQLARYKWSEICNVSSGIPLVIINMPSSQHCKLSTNRMRCATIFHMNCKIHKSLLLEYCNQVKKIYFLKSVVANGDLRMNLSILYHCLSSAIKIVVYEIDLNDDVVQEAATCLRKEGYTHINFILASRTKLLASSSSYHQIAPLLEKNLLINNLQLKKFAMPFPYDCRFTRTIRNTSRTWELVDLSGCNIRDSGCLQLQECFVASECTITHLNLMYNNLSSASAAAVANTILKCNVKMVNISSNTLQHNQVINAFSSLKQSSTKALSVELISGDSTAIIISNTDSKLLPYHLWSSNFKIQLCIMRHFQVDYIDCILSSLYHSELSKVILQNNGLTFEQLECIINKLSVTNLYIQEAHIQYSSRFTDYSSESLMTNLVEIAREDSNSSPFSSLTFSKLDLKYNKICIYGNKIMPNTIENTLTKLVQWQISTTLVAIKLLNCYITSDTAIKLASFINELAHLKLFDLSHSHIQESDLKVVLIALQSTRSLNFFTIKSLDCFIKDSADDIASIITGNSSIMHFEVSHCDMKQSAVLKITKSLKKLNELKQLNLSGIALTCESLDFALEDKCTLKELNLSNCKLQKPEIIKISSALERAKLSSINLSHNNISDYAANRLASLLLNQSIANVDISYCNLQEEGMSCIINALKYKSLKSLNFCGNRITDFLASEISAGISNNPYIMNLDLSNCNLQEIGIEEILTSLKSHIFYLTTFKISSIVSTEETSSLFGAILDNNKGIENLTLQNCNCERIFNAVRKKVSTLRLLDINSSVITFKNIISIVINNTHIKHLNISNCDVQGELDVTNNDLSGLFLEYLNLGGNMITKAFADFFSNVISANYKLKHLDIANCEVKETELIKITNSLKLLTSLNYLNYSKLVISTQVACILSQVIANNVHLEHLDISFCFLNEQTFLPIASALKQLKLLKYFILHSNYITLDETKLSTILSGNSSDKMLVTDDYDTISLATSELIPPRSSDRKSPIPVNQYNNILQEANRIKESVYSDMDGYDTISMAMGEALYSTIPQNLLYDEFSSPSKCTKSAKADDHDTVSLATGEITVVCYSNINECSEVTDTKNTNTAHYPAIHKTPDERALHCSSSIYEDAILTDKPSKSYNSKNSYAGDVDSIYMATAADEMTPPYCTIPIASNENLSETTSTDGRDHKEISTVTGDIMPPCSSNVYDDSDPLSTDAEDYDTMSIASHEATLQFPNNDCSSSNSASPVKDELSQSYHHSSVDEDDYDTISVVDSETTSHHSDKMLENASRNVNDILAADDITTESDRSLESPLHDHDYDTVSIDDNPSYLCSKKSEGVLQDDYENMLLETHNLITKHDYCDENTSTVVYETVPAVSDTISSVSIIHRIPGKATSAELISVKDSLGNTSQDFYENVVGEATQSYSSDKTSDHQNVISLSESTVTDQYEDTLLKNDSTTTEYYSTKILENTILDEYNDIHYSLTEPATFDCDKNTSLSLSVTINEISEVIACNNFLECFDISDCKLSELQIENVATALSKTSTLKHLNLSQSTIATNNTALKVASVITSNLSLENINLSDCQLQESGIKIITRALAMLSSLVSIDLSENKITYDSMPIVAAAIRENSLLQQLNISHCIEYNEEFKSATKLEGMNNILMPLTMLTCLKYLNLHSNYVNDVTSKLLPVVISSNKSLSHLDFTNCKLTNTSLIAIGKKLQATFTLKYLSLSSNIITNEAAHEIALAVSNNLSLQHLALSDCKMEERALMDIAESLLNISSLKHLDLSYSIITDKAAATLASSISNNTLLAFLDLKHCVWEKTGFSRIHKVFRKLPMLKEVDTQ